MSNAKRASALYDVLDCNQATLDSNPADAGENGGGGVADDPTAPPQGALGRSRVGGCGRGAVDGELLARAPLELVEGMVRVSLTPTQSAVVVLLAALVVLGGYAIGRSSGHRGGDETGFARGFEQGRLSYEGDVLDDIKAAQAEPIAAHLLAGLERETSGTDVGATAAAPNDASAGGSTWIPGNTYIVVQNFSTGAKASAIVARDFLTERSVETKLVTLRNGKLQLITTAGFDRRVKDQSRKADRLLKEVGRIGRAFVAAGGRHGLQGYFATFTGDNW